jgi:ribosomal protein S13
VISGAVTLAVCLITNHAQQEKTRALMEYQLKELSQRVEKHNNVIERTYLLEGQMRECQHDIQDLKGYHKPN